MSKTVWAIADVSDGRLISSSPGVATLARELAGDGAAAIVVAANATGAAAELAAYVPHVILGLVPADEYFTPSAVAPFIARLVRERRPDYLLVPGTPTGRELAGALSALLQWGVLANATGALLADRLVVRSVVFRTDLNVQSAFTSDHGIVTVQPHAVGPSVAAATGDVEEIDVAAAERTSLVRRSELVIEEAPAPVEGARVVVAGGAGVGSKEAWALVESLAAVLDGAVGRAAPRSTTAGRRTASRSARRARPSVRTSTSRSASPARFSTGSACGCRRRWSWSTRIPTRPSPGLPTFSCTPISRRSCHGSSSSYE